MKHVPLGIVLFVITCALAITPSCIYNELTSEIVVTTTVCGQYEETRTSPDFYSYEADGMFRERLMQNLERNGFTLADVRSANVVSGTYKVSKPPKTKHDWVISGNVQVARQDVPGGPITDGPASLIDLFNESLKDAKGKPIPADLNADGVAVIDRALAAVIAGEDPRLILIMESGNVDPAPSTSDPLEFKWIACVTFQAVIAVDMTEQ